MTDSIQQAARRIKGQALLLRNSFNDKGNSRYNVGRMGGLEEAVQIIGREVGLDMEQISPIYDDKEKGPQNYSTSELMRLAVRKIRGQIQAHKTMLDSNDSYFNAGKLNGLEQALEIVGEETGIDFAGQPPIYEKPKEMALPVY